MVSRATALLLLILLAGCAADRPLHVNIDDDIIRPQPAVVVFFIDGFGQKEFDEALAEDRVPNITRHIFDRGVRVESAVTCIPSITYAISVTFITGRYPGHHGIVSNKWFDPSTGRYQDYCYIKTYQRVDDDYRSAPTIYEILHDRVTVSIQAAMRRGCTHTIDNWATSGINWFFNNVTGVDCLVAQRFELIAEHTRRWGQWPDFIWAYFPGLDAIGHRFGPESRRHKRAVANVDLQIGRICEALQDIGMYDRTYLCLVSDHGMVPVEKDNVFDIAEFLREKTGAKIWSNRYTEPGDEAKLLNEYDYAVATTASRWTAVYPISGSRHPSNARIDALAEAMDANGEPQGGGDRIGILNARAALPAWLSEAVSHPAVELVALNFRPGKVHLFTRDGYAVVTRTNGRNQRHTVWQQPGGEILAPDELLTTPAASPTRQWGHERDARATSQTHAIESDSREWLQATANAKHPDLVPQIVAMFDSERAGSIVFFAAEGWDFSTDDPAGGHGSILAAEMRVPMLFAGPDLPPGEIIPFARTCDLMPTLLHLLNAEPVLKDGSRVDIDGIDLLTCLEHKGDP